MAKKSPAPPSYRLTTLNDIFERVPADRIPLCCAEIGALLASAKATHQAIVAAARERGLKGRPGDWEFSFRFPVTWVDDNRGHIETRISAKLPRKKKAQPVLSVVVKRTTR